MRARLLKAEVYSRFTTSERAQERLTLASDHERRSRVVGSHHALAARAYHGTFAPFWWGLHPPLPAPFQLPEVAPPVPASRSIPQPDRPGITLRPLREGKSAWAESNFSVTRRRFIIREFFTTAQRRQLQEGATLSRHTHTHTYHSSGGRKGTAAGHNERASAGGLKSGRHTRATAQKRVRER